MLGEDGAIAASQSCGQGDIDEWRAQADADETPPYFEAALIDPVAGEPIGALIVGPRPDGARCNRDEREALLSVAPAIARAVATARTRGAARRTPYSAVERRLSSYSVRIPSYGSFKALYCVKS